MATHLIIDGYNLLGVKAAGFAAAKSEMAREALLHDLAAYRHRKGHAVTVVFDGWQQGYPVEHREHRAGVQVIYSRKGEKADQVIQRLAREYGSACAVVSSDHEIVATARAHGATVMTAQLFMSKLVPIGRSPGSIQGKELDSGEDERPSRGPEKKGNPRKLPKAMRERNRQLKRF
ncbi:MAG: NYN domain-containing protein [Nitrospira sp.]|nr:NYN domain-containing protein [Nitrospira sp.]